MDHYKATVSIDDGGGKVGDYVFLFPPRVNETIHIKVNGKLETLVVVDVLHFGADLDENQPWIFLVTNRYVEEKHGRYAVNQWTARSSSSASES